MGQAARQTQGWKHPFLPRAYLIILVHPGNVGNPQPSPPGSLGCQHGILPQPKQQDQAAEAPPVHGNIAGFLQSMLDGLQGKPPPRFACIQPAFPHAPNSCSLPLPPQYALEHALANSSRPSEPLTFLPFSLSGR